MESKPIAQLSLGDLVVAIDTLRSSLTVGGYWCGFTKESREETLGRLLQIADGIPVKLHIDQPT